LYRCAACQAIERRRWRAKYGNNFQWFDEHRVELNERARIRRFLATLN
jgi:hypothetical protein